MTEEAAPKIDIAKRTDQYIRLRDKIKDIKDRHKKELAPYNDALEQLNNMLLGFLNDTNQDNASVRDVGTVYKKTKVSATIEDASDFNRHVIGTEAWHLVDWRANAPAVEAYIEEHQETPPGVKYSTYTDVGVRTATSK